MIDHHPQPYRPLNDSVRILRPSRNAGYGSGCNVALGALASAGIAARDIVICLNNDVVVTPDALSILRQWWIAPRPPALLAAATQQNNQIYAGLGQVNLFTGRADIMPLPSPLTLARYYLPYVHAALIAAPYEVWLRLHGWPEQYFLYWEDVSLSYQARQRGIELHTTASVIAWHQHGVAAGANHQTYYLVRNGALFLEQELPPPWRVYWQWRNRLRRAWHALRCSSLDIRQGLRDAAARRTGPHPETKNALA